MLRCVDIDAATTSRHQRIDASRHGSVGANLFALVDCNGAIITCLWDAAHRLIDLVAAVIGLLILAPFLSFIARSTL